MYIEPLMPVAECIVVAALLISVVVCKYVTKKRYVKKYPCEVQRFLRSTNRIINS